MDDFSTYFFTLESDYNLSTNITNDNDHIVTEESHNDHVIVILAPFMLLGFGALLRHCTKSLPLPYTMQLLLVGTILGLLLRSERWDDALQHSIQILGNMDPHLMLHIFLPPLIFESAASLEWHLFSRAKLYIFALAGPGLLLASVLTGIVLTYVMNQSGTHETMSCVGGYSWSNQASLMLGVIMSATDPVAVVALLKDLGCKASLSTGIEGESLLNDGSALVMFTILVKMVEGDDSDSVDDYIWTFVKMSFGGCFFGISFAVIMVQWLRLIFNDALAEITITLSGAYLCFFIAEYFLHVSGVIAVVCLGLYFGHNGRTSVSPEVATFLLEFWEMLAFFGNTLIFVIAGTVIGYKLPSAPMADYLWLLVMYAACTIIRAIVIGLVYFTFKIVGADIERNDQIIAVWAGLRGAVGLSLAMMVFSNSKICEPIRETVMFHTAGIVVLTVCINSTTMPKLVSILGLDSIAPSKQLIYGQAIDTILTSGKKQECILRADHLFDSTNWEMARKYYFHSDNDQIKMKQTSTDFASDAEKEARRRVLMITKKSYWRQFKAGLLSHQSIQYLSHHADLAIDDECCLASEWKHYAQLVKLNSSLDKGTDKLVPTDGSSESERRKLKILNLLDSIPVILGILVLVFVSCSLVFILDQDSLAYLIIEHTTTFIFFMELCARLYCLPYWQAFAVDPYIIIDVLAVSLDILLLSTGDLLGSFSDFSKSIRSIRFLRMIRLLRLARVAKKIKSVKVAAINKRTTSFWDHAENWRDRYHRRMLFSQLKLGYEIATGFKVAREEVLSAIERSHITGSSLGKVIEQIEKDLKGVRSALLDMQRLYSEIAASITTTVAARTVLNKQRNTINNLYREGLLDVNEYKKLRGSVEYQMKTLTNQPPIMKVPKKIDILRQLPWLECVDSELIAEITENFEDSVFKRGDYLVRQNDSSDTVHVLARGTVAVSFHNESGHDIEFDELGIGSVFGEIAWALNCKRGANIIATSPGLLFSISGQKLKELAQNHSELEIKLWETCGRRLAENMLSLQSEKSRHKIRESVNEMSVYSVDPLNKKRHFKNNGEVIILRGFVIIQENDLGANEVVEAPKVLKVSSTCTTYLVEFSTDAKYLCNPLMICTDDGDEHVLRDVKTVSSIDIEINRSSTFSTDLTTGLGSPSTSEIPNEKLRRLSLVSRDNDTKKKNINFKRRSTIHV